MLKNRKWWVAGLLLLLILVKLPSFFQDFMDSDEAIYGSVAIAIQHGDYPYRDAIERKTPLTYYFYATVFTLFGTGNMLAVHLTMILWVAVVAWLLYRIAAELSKGAAKYRYAPWGAALSYILFASFFNFEMLAANCEMLLDLPLALGFWLLLVAQRRRDWVLFFASGLAFGTAFLFKQTALLPFLFALGYVELQFYKAKKSEIVRLALDAVVLASGFVAVVALSVGLFYLAGVHKDYIYWAWTVNFQYIQDSFDRGYILKKFAWMTLTFLVSLLPLLIMATRYFQKFLRLSVRAWLPVLWLAGQSTALWVSGKFYAHYYYSLMAPLAILAGFGIWEFSRRRQVILLMSSLALGTMFCFGWFFKDALHRWYGYPVSDTKSVAAHIESRTERNEKIFVWGYSPEIYVQAKRQSASRFVFCDYLTGRISGHPRVEDPTFDTTPYINPKAWSWFQEDMVKNSPIYFIDTSPGNFHQYRRYPIKQFPWLQAFVQENYVFEQRVAGADIYRKIPTGVVASK